MTEVLADARPTATTRLIGNRLIIARGMWAVLVGITLALFVFGLPRYVEDAGKIINAFYSPPLDQNGVNVALIFSLGRRVVTFAIVFIIALVIFWRRSDNPVALIVSGGLIVAGANLLLVPIDYRQPGHALQQDIPGVLATLVGYLGLVFEVGIFYWLPSGTFVPQWSRWVFAAWALLSGAILWLTPFEQLDGMMNILAIPFIAIGIYCQVYRFRRVSEPVQRQQIKWVIIGIVPAGIWSLIHLVLLPAAFPEINTGGWPRVLYNLGSGTIWYITIVAVPICFLIAALRYRLWDVDIVVNRSMAYGALTVILAVVYFGIIILLQALLEAVTGGERSDLVIVASTLVIAALFQPIRQRVQTMIDRRFPNPLARYKPPDAAHIVHDPLTGKHFGTYEVLEPLGSGGMAEIYRGRHTSLNREVAIKVLRSGFGIDPEFRIRFEREAQTVAALRHSNIVQVFDFGVQDGQHYMVMEFIRGYDMARYLRENGRLKLSEALPIIQDVAAALDYAHEQGLIHRDVKPSNVMLQPVTGSQIKIQSPLQAYRAILTDFGVAKILSDGSDLTKTGVVGTLDYLAPEQIIAPKDIDRRADVYAFGAMVYEMLCGRPPFKDENYGVVLYAHLQQPPPDPRTIVPELPENAARVMLRALAKDRAERFATAGAFSAALTGVTPPV